MNNVNTAILSFIAFVFVSKVIWTLLLDYEPFETWKRRMQWRIRTLKGYLKEAPEGWLEWLKSLSGLKKLYFVLAGVAVSILFYSFWFIFPKFIAKIDNDDTSFYNLSLAVFAILSGLGAVFGFYTSIIRTETAEQGLITDRLNKATEGLGKNNADSGNPVVEVRLGALYALERIAQDSIRDHVQIMEILCAYVRYNSPRTYETDKADRSFPLREDIQAAITIIGRREKWPECQKRMDIEEEREYSINLTNCYLHAINFSDVNLHNALFDGADLRYALLFNADMRFASFFGTDLRNACMDEADMSGVHIKGAEMKGAEMENAYVYRGDFSNCVGLDEYQIKEMFLGIDVKIPTDWKHPQKGTNYYKRYDTMIDFYTAREECMEEMAEAKAAAEERAEAEEDAARWEQAQMDKLDDERDRGMK